MLPTHTPLYNDMTLVCIIIGTVGIGIVNLKSEPGWVWAGAVITMGALAIMFYALAVYISRTDRLANKGEE